MNDETLDQLADLLLERVMAKLSPVPAPPEDTADGWPEWDEYGGEPVLVGGGPSSPPAQAPAVLDTAALGYEKPLPAVAQDGSPTYLAPPTTIDPSRALQDLKTDWARMQAAGVDPRKRPPNPWGGE